MSGGWIKRGKQLVSNINARICECIQQCRFAGIGVSNQGNNRDVGFAALLAVAIAMLTHFFQLIFQLVDAFIDLTPVDFQLSLTRTAKTNTTHTAASPGSPTGLPSKVSPGSCQARQAILILGQFNLQHTFTSISVLGKDIQDQCSPVQDLHIAVEFFFQLALMPGR